MLCCHSNNISSFSTQISSTDNLSCVYWKFKLYIELLVICNLNCIEAPHLENICDVIYEKTTTVKSSQKQFCIYTAAIYT